MITRIKKIKNLGIFNDFTSSSSLPDFRRFNLIYGWNGSGKTTLSELFTIFEGGNLVDYPNVEYKITNNANDYPQNFPIDTNVRVFNQSYITENIDIIQSKAKSILITGKVNKELVEIIKKDEKLLKGDPEKENDLGKLKTLEIKKKEHSTKINQKNKQFTDVARIISANTSGVSARNYNKRNAKIAFEKLEQKQILSEEEQDNYSLTLKQQQKNNLSLINKAITKNIKQISIDSKSILAKTVETIVIERLKENDDISKWVEDGLKLHQEKESKSCEFCNQQLPEKRITDLLNYFNDADKKLKEEIGSLLSRIRKLYSSINQLSILDKANLYGEFQEYYSESIEDVNKYKIELLKDIERLGKLVKSKKQKTTEILKMADEIDDGLFITAIDKANSFIIDCNAKTTDFVAAKEIARINLENHYLSEVHDEIKSAEFES